MWSQVTPMKRSWKGHDPQVENQRSRRSHAVLCGGGENRSRSHSPIGLCILDLLRILPCRSLPSSSLGFPPSVFLVLKFCCLWGVGLSRVISPFPLSEDLSLSLWTLPIFNKQSLFLLLCVLYNSLFRDTRTWTVFWTQIQTYNSGILLCRTQISHQGNCTVTPEVQGPGLSRGRKWQRASTQKPRRVQL